MYVCTLALLNDDNSLVSALRFLGIVVKYLFRSGRQFVNIDINSVIFCEQEAVQSPVSIAATRHNNLHVRLDMPD